MDRLAPLPPSGRLLGGLVAWGLFFAASPGISGRGGSLLLAVLAVAVWTWTGVHPLGPSRKRALLAEWLAGGLGGAALMWWVSYVVPGSLLYICLGWGAYVVASGGLLRALAPSLPLPLAAALAWSGVETLRFVLPLPFGLGWLRLGHYAHEQLWLSGMARVSGVEGLSFVLAALGAGLATLAIERRARASVLASALAPLALGAATAQAARAPAMTDGPRVLLVQPGFPQERKLVDDPRLNFASSRDLTYATLEELRARGEPEPDFVCWGESMLYVRLFDERVAEAVRSGVRGPTWHDPLSNEFLADLRASEDYWVRRELLDLQKYATSARRRWPEGTSFCAGAETYDLVGDEIRRRVALVCYDSEGRRAATAAKSHLVPLAETMWGFERLGWVRTIAESAAGYVPDFVPARETGILEIETRSGERFSFSGTLCFDNAFLDPYVEAVRRGVDFHLVASNEAWYEESCEMDQMVAFSRLIALSTGRSIVRATNSGVSLVIDPSGGELGRVESGGKDRAVPGTRVWTVPVPRERTAGPTLYARLFEGVVAAFVLAPLAALLLGRRRARYRSSERC